MVRADVYEITKLEHASMLGQELKTKSVAHKVPVIKISDGIYQINYDLGKVKSLDLIQYKHNNQLRHTIVVK